MKNEPSFRKLPPKAEVLRKIAQRYPEVEPDAVQVLINIDRVSAAGQCVASQFLEPYGLSEGRFYVLACLLTEELLDAPAPSPSEIAEHLGVTRATITGLLDGLERDGFLERRHDSRDRRALTIHMTEKTRRFLDEFIPEHSRRINALMADLSADDRRQLIALLSKIEA
jgi:DNA-binding MarR family transcriptional regulator